MYVTVRDSNNEEAARSKLDYDIRQLLPGEADIQYNIDLKSDLESGEYKIFLFIADSEDGNPAIEFANINSEEKECYLGSFQINHPGQK